MLGAKIRQRRTELGLSLQELATMTNLTPSFLSQVERDLSEPSLASLRRIASALEVPIFYFLVDEDNHKPLVRVKDRRTMEFPDAGIVYQLLSPLDFVNRSMEIVVTRMAAGKGEVHGGNHPITHPGEEAIVVLRGKARIHVGDAEYDLGPGDCLYFFASIPHQVRNIGDEELEFLAAITPPAF